MDHVHLVDKQSFNSGTAKVLPTTSYAKFSNSSTIAPSQC